MNRTTCEAGSTAYGLPGRIGDQDSGQAMFGEHAGSVQRVGIDGYHREFLGHVFGVHISTIRSVRSLVCSFHVVRSRRVYPATPSATRLAPISDQRADRHPVGRRIGHGGKVGERRQASHPIRCE